MYVYVCLCIGLLHDGLPVTMYEYTCCDELTDDSVSTSCGEYVGFKDKTFDYTSTKAAAIFGGSGGVYLGTFVYMYIYIHVFI